jgi:phosphatidylinositol alpha-1,6-mannosyltransferase
LRILFIGAETYSQIGGLQQFNQRLLRALGDMYAGSVTALIMRDGAEHFPKDIGGNFGSIAKRPRMIVEVARRARQLDVLLIGQINLLPAALAARLINPRLRIIMFVHGDEVWNDPIYRKMRAYEPWLCGRLDRIAAVSRYTAQRMQQAFHLPAALFDYFPNAVDPYELVEPQTRSATVLCVCRLAAHDHGKHVDALIRAMPMVRARLPEARLRIVGAGVLLDDLKILAETLGLSGCVQFDGRVSNEALAAAYLDASVFAMPSSKEGFGIVFLEAWQHGLPVICGTMDAAHEVVTDGKDGFAVHHDDIAGLGEKMIFLLSNPEVATAMARAGAEKVATIYSDASFRSRLKDLIGGAK